jgi:putative membrane protein
MISPEDRERLAQAIREAEARTSGEIVVVLARSAGGYRSVPLLYAFLAALATPWPLLWLTALGPTRIFQVQLLVALVLSILLSLSGRRYGLVPGFIKRARAHEAAMREFVGRGLTRTRDRTGVLLFVAQAERYAEIVPDAGIAGTVDPQVWKEAIEGLLEAIRAGRVAEGLLGTVERIGPVLAAAAPPREDDGDELPNRVIVL